MSLDSTESDVGLEVKNSKMQRRQTTNESGPVHGKHRF